MKSQIDILNPMDYEHDMELYPSTYIDHFNQTPRKIRCISDGTDEMIYFAKNPDEFGIGTNIWMCDVDDFTYYLRGIIRDGLLEAGREYDLVDTYVEMDVEFGMVELREQPEDGDEFEDFHGFPAFLFEEVRPVSLEERKKNRDNYWKQFEEEEG